jgi:SAM-dependent methyltransferase
MRGRSKAAESQNDAFLLHACPLIRKFYTRMADAAMGKPILDIACGSGRNAFPLAAHGCTVICADNDLTRFHLPKNLKGHLIPRQLDFVTGTWPFAPSSAGGILSVHFLLPTLLPHFEESLSPGAYLLLETVPGCGGNYLQLPRKGQLRYLLEDSFDLEFYKERNVGPHECGAVAVQLFARRI